MKAAVKYRTRYNPKTRNWTAWASTKWVALDPLCGPDPVWFEFGKTQEEAVNKLKSDVSIDVGADCRWVEVVG